MDYKIKVIYSIALLAIFIFLVSSVSADLKDFFLSPSAPTDVSVQVGNAAPVVNIIVLDNPITLLSATTVSVNIDFTAEDPNGLPGSNLDDSSVTISFDYPAGGPYTESRSGGIADCLTSDLGNVRTYDCAMTMQYFDANGLWDVSVSVDDNAVPPLTGSDSSTTTVNLLRDITLTTGSPISFGAVAPGQNDITTTPTSVDNNGNYMGTIDVTAQNLEDSVFSDIIPAGNFNTAGSSGAATVCTAGTTLIDAIVVTITSTNLQKDTIPGENLGEDISWCLDVPSGIASATYSTTEGTSGPWTIEI